MFNVKFTCRCKIVTVEGKIQVAVIIHLEHFKYLMQTYTYLFGQILFQNMSSPENTQSSEPPLNLTPQTRVESGLDVLQNVQAAI